MFKKIFILIFLVFLVGCKSTNSGYVHNKKRNKLIDKHLYREQLKNRKANSKANSKSGRNRGDEKLVATSNISVSGDVVLDYIDRYKDIAKNNMVNSGIPASIILAQGILESGSGRGTLSRKANNHFGIKCHTDWKGATIRHDDDELAECFRKYKTPEESFKDHSLFLTTRNRYSKLFLLDKSDYKAWAKGLKKAGYATDSKYPEKLISLIERYELFNFDNEVLGLDPKEKIIETPAAYKIYEVLIGDTLYSISKQHNMTVDELKELNNLSDNNISEGQVLKVK